MRDGVNGAIVLANKYDLPFKYYCIIDQNFVRDRIALVREIVSRDLTLYISPEVLRYIVQGVPQEEIRCRICIIELILERAYQRSTAPATLVRMVQANPDLHLLDAELGLGFSFNAALGVFDADTVAYAALQVLFSYGARNLYVHGLDLSLENGLRFYDEGVSPQSSRLARHFARVIEPSFRFAARHWAERGLSVYNLSPVSALPPDVIERKDWRELLKPGAVEAQRNRLNRVTLARVVDGNPAASALIRNRPASRAGLFILVAAKAARRV